MAAALEELFTFSLARLEESNTSEAHIRTLLPAKPHAPRTIADTPAAIAARRRMARAQRRPSLAIHARPVHGAQLSL